MRSADDARYRTRHTVWRPGHRIVSSRFPPTGLFDRVADAGDLDAIYAVEALTNDRVRVNTAWAFNVVRTLPGRGVQSWSQPADVRPRPEGMSILMFFQPPGKEEK